MIAFSFLPAETISRDRNCIYPSFNYSTLRFPPCFLNVFLFKKKKSALRKKRKESHSLIARCPVMTKLSSSREGAKSKCVRSDEDLGVVNLCHQGKVMS